MATVVEYGVISALIAVAAIAATRSCSEQPKSKIVKSVSDPKRILKLVSQIDSPGEAVYIDTSTGCRYISSHSGTPVRSQLSIYCPSSK